MIPTAMLIGLIVALLLPAAWSIPVAGLVWTLIISVSVDSDPSVLVVAFLLGSLNGAVGVAIGRGLRLLTNHLVSRLRDRAAV